MNSGIRRTAIIIMLLLSALGIKAQGGLAIDEAFKRFGSQKGSKMVSLSDERLRGYEMKVYKSLSFSRNAREIRSLLRQDRPKAAKTKEVVVEGLLMSGCYTMPALREGINRYVLFRFRESGEGVLIYIEGALSYDDIKKITGNKMK